MKNKLHTFTTMFVVLWLLSIFVFLTTLFFGTDKFSSDITSTQFGKSIIFSPLFFGSLITGVISFILAIVIYPIHSIVMLCKSHPKVGIIIISIVLGIFVTIGYFIKSQGIYNVILKTVQDSSSLQIASPTSYSGSNTPISRAIPTTTPKPKKKLDGGYLFNLVNGYRAKNGLQQMTWWHQLCEYSKARSTQIQTDWSHAGFNKDAAEGKLRGEYCPECGKLGENLAKDYWTEEEILQAWIKSPDHKANLDDPLWNAGCAMVYNNNYISFEFGQRQ